MNFKNPQVSIIIPCYNRENLILQTLKSIQKQTEKNWECIIIDDESTDESLSLIQDIAKNDLRFKPFLRPLNLKKGANSCRNYGLQMSKGDYIIWFDSDDLMTIDHIEVKLKNLTESIDFVISRTQNFRDNKLQKPYEYTIEENGITLENFLFREIGWYTYDVLLRRGIALQISYNENLFFWQDFNYFSKMLVITNKGKFIDRILTHRRVHNDSIQFTFSSNETIFQENIIKVIFITLIDLEKNISIRIEKKMYFWLMNSVYKCCETTLNFPKKTEIFKKINDKYGSRPLIYFKLSLVFNNILGKGNFLLKKAKDNLK